MSETLNKKISDWLRISPFIAVFLAISIAFPHLASAFERPTWEQMRDSDEKLGHAIADQFNFFETYAEMCFSRVFVFDRPLSKGNSTMTIYNHTNCVIYDSGHNIFVTLGGSGFSVDKSRHLAKARFFHHIQAMENNELVRLKFKAEEAALCRQHKCDPCTSGCAEKFDDEYIELYDKHFRKEPMDFKNWRAKQEKDWDGFLHDSETDDRLDLTGHQICMGCRLLVSLIDTDKISMVYYLIDEEHNITRSYDLDQTWQEFSTKWRYD